MSRPRVRCAWCGRAKGHTKDLCTNPECSTNQKLIHRARHPAPVRIDTSGRTNRERPHTQMALAFARAIVAREEPHMGPGEKARFEADERARAALRSVGNDWTKLPHQNTSDWYLALRARAIQAEEALKALKTNSGYVEATERESLLNQIAELNTTLEERSAEYQTLLGEYSRLQQDFDALRVRVQDYGDMPDPQETRRRMDTLAQEVRHVQETLANAQRKVTELQADKSKAEDLIQNLKRDMAKSGRFTDEAVLDLLMPLARRVHGLESKLFEQAGIFP